MSSLVSDLFINPLRRQVRRFSRPNINPEHIDSLTNQHVIQDHAPDSPHNDDDDVGNTSNSGPDDRYNAVLDAENTLSGSPMVSSPIDEHGGLEQELASAHANRSASAPGTIERTHSVPLRLSSLRSNSRHIDDDMSDNPEFNILDRFPTESPRHMSTSSQTHDLNMQTQTPAEGNSRRSTQDGSRSNSLNPGSRQRDTSLPEDDGMGVLRRRILLIQESDLHAEEKARLMQKLLTEGHRVTSQAQQYEKAIPIPQSSNKTISQDMPPSPGSLSSLKFWPVSGTPNSSHSAAAVNRFHLSPDDLRATYAPLVPREPSGDDAEDCEEVSEPVPALGCQHYRRNVKLQCSQCQKWYTCRFCHDEVEEHALIRKETKNMLCMLCGCAQRAAEVCIDCNVRSAWYYCSVCKLWDDDTNKNIYHCNDCGICRIGRGLGKDFYHCKTCGVCMSIAIEHSHKCIERSTDCDCPICGEYMFTSPQTVVFMNCGHSIHHKCYYDHMKSSYKCPICSKSIVNMETQFRNLDRAIDSQPMPPQFRDTKAMVSCNDCQAKSAVKYHWLGLKCAVCDSYNTAQLSILSDPEPAETVSTDTTADAVDAPVPENTLSVTQARNIPVPNRHRRASSQQGNRPISSASHAAPSRFSPYPLPQRLGRSVSPIRNYGTEELLAVVGTTEDASDDDDDLDFWGRDGSNADVDTAGEEGNEEEEEEEEDEEDDYEDDSGSAMDEDDDEGDEDGDDQMELFGHR